MDNPLKELYGFKKRIGNRSKSTTEEELKRLRKRASNYS